MPKMNWLSTGKAGARGSCAIRDGQGEHGHRLAFRAGRVVKLRMFNDPAIVPRDAASHPSARPALSRVDARRRADTNLVWKDTAIIPAGETVDLLVDMSNPGPLDAALSHRRAFEAGMMAMFTVESAGQKRSAKRNAERDIVKRRLFLSGESIVMTSNVSDCVDHDSARWQCAHAAPDSPRRLER